MTPFGLNPYHKNRQVHQMYLRERKGPYPKRIYIGSFKTAERADIAGRLAQYWIHNGYATPDTVPRSVRNKRKQHA